MTTKARAHLRSLAMTLRPITQIGKDGITPALVDSVEAAIEKRELVKLSVLQTSPVFAAEAAELLAEQTRSEVVQVIGNKLVLYRKNRDKPVIVLPR